jgi:hypothetical protein
MGLTTLATLIEKMSQQIGDWLEVTTTTNIAGGNTNVISTELNQYDKGTDDYFSEPSYWCYIDGVANAGVLRQVSDYVTTTGTLTLRGANLAAESAAVNIRLFRYSRTDYVRCLNDTILEKYPETFLYLDNRDLITGNILPPFNWATTSTLDIYTKPTGTLLKNTNGAYIWRGSSSAKVTASGADDYLYISSDNYNRLLDLMDKEVDFKCWVYPEVANDVFLTIYTVKKDGIAQTLNSTTTTYAGKKCLIELEDQSINDDIEHFEARLRVHTAAKYSYFDMPRLIGGEVHEYLLPQDFQDGDVSEVHIQVSGHSDDMCDDLMPTHWQQVFNAKVRNDGTYNYLYLPDSYSSNRQIRLIGHKPLETLSADADTISLDQEHIRPLLAYASYLLFERQKEGVSSEDIGRIISAAAYWLGKYNMLSKLNPKKRVYMHLPSIP